MTTEDWTAVAAIYADGIATGDATFETNVPDWLDWDAEHLSACRLVAKEAVTVAGWAALSPVSDRCAYGGVAEVSVYVGAGARGRGIGKALLIELIKSSEAAGIWTLQAGIFPENETSIALHRDAGFRVIGTRERLGEMNGVWRDVMLLERRSKAIGV